MIVVSNGGGNNEEMESAHAFNQETAQKRVELHMECGANCFSCIFFKE